VFGTFQVKANDESELGAALFRGLTSASAVLVAMMVVATLILQPTPEGYGHWGVFGAVVIGLAAGVVFG
jgi:hypothetical protein